MIRSALLILLTLLSLAGAGSVSASSMPGAWHIYPINGAFSRILETPSKVWYVSGGTLSSYDKEADETRTYLAGSELSSFGVRDIRYNPDGKYLAVAYDNSDIDLIYDNGNIVNLPDIKDATVTVERGINDMVFHDGVIYVATDFGIVAFDEARAEVRESGIYNGHPVKALCALADGLAIVPGPEADSTYPVLFNPWGERLNRYDRFEKMVGNVWGTLSWLTPSGGNGFNCLRFGRIYHLELRPGQTPAASATEPSTTTYGASYLIPDGEGGAYFHSSFGGDAIYRTSPDNSAPVKVCDLPESLSGCLFATIDGPDRSLWAGSEAGLGRYRISSEGKIDVLREPSVPAGSITFAEVSRIYPANQGFIISNLGQNRGYPIGEGDFFDKAVTADLIEPTDGTDVDITSLRPVVTTWNAPYTNHPTVTSPTYISQDPDYPERFYFASAVEGVYVIENGVEVAHFHGGNAPIPQNWLYNCSYAGIDHLGNLWVAQRTPDGVNSVEILPAAKRRLRDLSGLTASDWVVPGGRHTVNDRLVTPLVCTRSNVVFIFDTFNDSMFDIIGHGGDPADLSGQQYASWTTLTDTDGKSFVPERIFCGVEDRRGHVWFGTSEGVISVANPATALTSQFAVSRIKVPRNDGTNLADYLLSTSLCYDIAVDNSNRKWIATAESGLYLVSENGDEIIANYTSSNSPLPSNTVCSLYADPGSNLLYVGTMQGLFVLSTDSSPARPDFKQVLAYPNPLTPDYSGLVTITGLMDNSVVKITDSAMNLVYQTVSNGGMATWDGCNLNGQKVRSGVYYVVASSGSDSEGSSSGAVATRILVVN